MKPIIAGIYHASYLLFHFPAVLKQLLAFTNPRCLKYQETKATLAVC